MEEYVVSTFIYMNSMGLLGTRAPMGIDIIITFLSLLPLLNWFSIYLATRKKLKLHQITQYLLFLLSIIVLGLFASFVHGKETLSLLIEESNIAYTKAFALVLLHILVTLTTLTLWLFTIIYAQSDKKRNALPGLYSVSHKRSGKRVFLAIVLMSISSLSVYWVLFVA